MQLEAKLLVVRDLNEETLDRLKEEREKFDRLKRANREVSERVRLTKEKLEEDKEFTAGQEEEMAELKALIAEKTKKTNETAKELVIARKLNEHESERNRYEMVTNAAYTTKLDFIE